MNKENVLQINEGIDNQRKDYMVLSGLLGAISVVLFVFLMNETINNLGEYKELQSTKNHYEVKIKELEKTIETISKK